MNHIYPGLKLFMEMSYKFYCKRSVRFLTKKSISCANVGNFTSKLSKGKISALETLRRYINIRTILLIFIIHTYIYII